MDRGGALGYSSPMSDTPPDFNALARRYLDLWQEQVAAVAADPALGEAVARGVAMMTQTAVAVAEATGVARNGGVRGAAASARNGAGSDEGTVSPGGTAPDRPQAAATASDDPRLHHDELARRVAALEERVATLEATFGGSGPQPVPQPRKRRPRGPQAV
ncbi:hypothetical protein A6A04_00950 [Paramagnetospirillum marisnigri]|uniref:Poly(3-hydroxyalkanoate) polymerase subunit PhaE n=1 Tax=Paramagnetospirillum marisnigri TaxID=1285242 RepID=A0A178MU58_9PROT|nr:hypothetical protein A6A04_00950 [Paramagnetospirillum marisnigri]